MSSTNPRPAEEFRRLGFTVAGLGRALGIPYRRFCNIASGRTLVRTDDAQVIADYVGVPVAELFPAEQIIPTLFSEDVSPVRTRNTGVAA